MGGICSAGVRPRRTAQRGQCGMAEGTRGAREWRARPAEQEISQAELVRAAECQTSAQQPLKSSA